MSDEAGHEQITTPKPAPAAALPWGAYAVGVALVLCFASYIGWMLERWWNDEYYGHGFIIPIIAGYIIIRHKDELAALPRRSHPLGLVLMALGILLHVAATYKNAHFPSGFAMILTMYGAVLWLWGWPVARAVAFPIFFLSFMVPVARLLVDKFGFPAQLLSAQLGGHAAAAIGIPAVVDGTSVQIPGYTFEVAIVCSGLKTAISMTALGTLYAYMLDTVMWKRLVIIAVSLPVAMLANSVRIMVTLVMGRIFGEKGAEGFLHSASGVLVFMFALIGLFAVGSVLRCNKIRDDM